MNDRRYTLPGPGEVYYLITLRGHCKDCDGPSTVLIETCVPGTFWHGYYKDENHSNGPLPFEKWSESQGCMITTGMSVEQFQAALSSYLVGINSDELGEDGVLDETAVEIILDEMYDDAQTRPTVG